MTDLTIPKAGMFSESWYVSGTTLTNAYARMVGYTQPSNGSPYLFDWSTSGGQIAVTGSTVSGGLISLWVNASGTSGLNFTMASWQLSVTLGSLTPFYDSGRIDLGPYSPGGR